MIGELQKVDSLAVVILMPLLKVDHHHQSGEIFDVQLLSCTHLTWVLNLVRC